MIYIYTPLPRFGQHDSSLQRAVSELVTAPETPLFPSPQTSGLNRNGCLLVSLGSPCFPSAFASDTGI